MPNYWMISDRDNNGTGGDRNNNGLTYWLSGGPNDAGQLRDIAKWNRVTPAQFRKALIDACNQFPDLPPAQQADEKHVALCVHGYNETFQDSIDFYSFLSCPSCLSCNPAPALTEVRTREGSNAGQEDRKDTREKVAEPSSTARSRGTSSLLPGLYNPDCFPFFPVPPVLLSPVSLLSFL